MELKRTRAAAIMERALKYRLISAVFLIILTAISIPGLFRLNISVNMKDFFIKSDPILKNDSEAAQFFKNSDFIGVLVESPHIYSRPTLELIRKTGRILRQSVPMAGKLLSITNLEDFPLGGKTLRFNGDTLLSSDEEIKSVRDNYSQIPSINGKLVSKEDDEAWILLDLGPYGNGWDQFSVGKAAYDAVKSIDTHGVRLTVTGVPVYAYRKQVEMMGDLMRVLLFGGIAALLLSSLILRSVRGVIGAVLVILLSVLTVLGIEGWRGTTIDSAFISVPILLTMGVSIGYTVHISRFFNLYFRKTGHRRDAVLYAVQESGKPILFTAFTTIAALFSFLSVSIRPIQWVGITSALSILAVCILTLFYFPMLLSLGKNRTISESEPQRIPAASFEPLMRRIPPFLERRSLWIILVFALTVIAGAIGLSRLQIDFNGVKMMGTKLSHMKDQIHISQSKLAATETMELIIRMTPGDFKNRENIAALEKLQTDLSGESLVKSTYSLADTVKEFNYLRYGRKSGEYIIPEKNSTTTGLLLFYDRLAPDMLRPWVTEDYSTAKVFISMKEFSSREIEALIGKIDTFMKQDFPAGSDYFLSGSSYQMAVMNQYITRGLVRSVLTATIMITLLLIILFRSVKVGLIAMIPNIYPLLVCGAIMGFAGIPMEFVTMTVAPMIMGLAVDDTIHFISHIRKDLKITGDAETSIRFAFSTVGTAITETTVILCLSFLVFTVSQVNSIKNMGILSAAGMGAAYLADIFMTPLLIKYFIKTPKIKKMHTKIPEKQPPVP